MENARGSPPRGAAAVYRISQAPRRKQRRAPMPGTVAGIPFVGLAGFEPATSCSQSRRATKLRYSPMRERAAHPPQDTHPTPDRRQQQALVTRRYDRICQMLQPAEYTIAEMRPQPRLPATHVSANNAKGRGTHVDPAANSLCCTPSETNPGYRSASGPCPSGYSPSRADSIGCSGSRLTGRVFGLNGNFSARIFS